MRRRREGVAGWLFASPWVVGFGVFLLYPLVASLYYSFCDFSVLRKPVFIGGENYAALVRDELFWLSLYNTLFYAVLAMPASLIVALVIALLLNQKVRGIGIYRTIFFLPSLVPAVSLAVLWMWLFNGERGLINELFGFLGISGPNWLTDPAWSKPALIFMGLWGVGQAVVIYLAGLQDVPQSLYEAAEIDGARPWHKTRFITLPMISPVILFNSIMGIIGTLQVFTIPYVISAQGAPVRSIYFYTMYLYDNAFSFQKMGYASAMGWILFLLIFGLTMLALRFGERRVHYGGS